MRAASRLFNLSTHPCIMQWFDDSYSNVEKFLQRHNLNGVELSIDRYTDIEKVPSELVKGVHLFYMPSWLSIYHNNTKELLKQYKSMDNVKRLYTDRYIQNSIDRFRKEIECCEKLEADYAVYHVADVGLDEVFFQHPFRYTCREVLDETMAFVNGIFGDTSFTLAFENLWWPGLDFHSYEQTKYYFDGIHNRNRGFVLDIGHLMLNRYLTDDEDRACTK